MSVNRDLHGIHRIGGLVDLVSRVMPTGLTRESHPVFRLAVPGVVECHGPGLTQQRIDRLPERIEDYCSYHLTSVTHWSRLVTMRQDPESVPGLDSSK